MLVAAALLMVRSFAAVRSISPGFDPAHVIAARITAPQGTYGLGTDRLARFYDDVLFRTRALPGVRDAALVDRPPLATPQWGQAIRVQGQHEDIKHDLPFVQHSEVA
jgi:hypothetical protein